MNASEIVSAELQSTSGFQVCQFLAVRVRKSSEAPKRHSQRQVRSLDMTCGYALGVGSPISYPNYDFYHFRGRISSSRIMLAIIAIQLYHLRVIRLACKHVLNAALIESKAVSSELESMILGNRIFQAAKKLVGSFTIPLAHGVSGNEFRCRVNRHEHPSIAKFGRVASANVPSLLSHERPNLIAFNGRRPKVTHPRLHKPFAMLTSFNDDSQNGVAVQLRDALGASNASSFQQQLNGKQRLIVRDGHSFQQSLVIFGKSLSAKLATKALQSIAVLPKLVTRNVAVIAIHSFNLQQPLAVCQENTRDNTSPSRGF